jgi:hypothetical protein
MKATVLALSLGLLCLSAKGSDKTVPGNGARPKWGFLGDDTDLRRTIKEADEAILACVYRVEFEDVKGPFATVILHVTVARTFKGKLKPNARITIGLRIDSVPLDAAGRDQHLKALRDADIGNLRICFVNRVGGTETAFDTEWLNVPKFTRGMNEFMEAYRRSAGTK